MNSNQSFIDSNPVLAYSLLFGFILFCIIIFIWFTKLFIQRIKEEKEEKFQSRLPRKTQLKIAENVEQLILDMQDEIEELKEKNQQLESELNSLKK